VCVCVCLSLSLSLFLPLSHSPICCKEEEWHKSSLWLLTFPPTPGLQAGVRELDTLCNNMSQPEQHHHQSMQVLLFFFFFFFFFRKVLMYFAQQDSCMWEIQVCDVKSYSPF
jgi:hypothetical protein